MRYLSLADTERLDLRMTEVVPIVERAFRLVAEGRAVAVPRVRLVHPPLATGSAGIGRPWRRDLRVVPGALEGVGFAVRLGTALREPGEERMAAGVLLVLFDWESMRLVAAISDQLVHAVRSTAPDGVLARHLALPGARMLAVIGAGRLARWAAEAVAAVRQLEELWLWSPTPERRADCARYLAGRLHGVRICEAASAEQAVREAEIVVTATTARSPVLSGAWLAPGTTVIVNRPEEVDGETLRRGRLVTTYLAGTLDHVPPYRALLDLLEAGELPREGFAVELPELIAGRAPGRRDAAEVVVCLNPGYGVIDAAVARYVYERALAMGLGVELEA